MLNKRIILSWLILCILFSTAETSIQFEAIPDSTIIRELTDQVYQLEINFYNSAEIDSPGFNQGMRILDSLIELYSSLALQTPGSNFANQAFSYLEKKKNIAILNLFQNSLPRPDSSHITTVSNIFDMLQDTNKVTETGRRLFAFMKQPVDISDLQKNFLDDHGAILSYFVLKNKISVYIFTEDSLQIVQWQAPSEQIKLLINKLMSPFYHEIDLLHLEFNIPISFQLYQYLFQPLEKYVQRYKIINIIPDDFLVGFPFELLITDTTLDINSNDGVYYHRYSQLSYLIKKYAISYNFSTSVFASTEDLDRTTNKLGQRLLTMSEPVIAHHPGRFINHSQSSTSHELEISDYSSDEIKRVSRLLFRHDNLKKEQVTKSFLFEQGKDYRWIYFALPGIFDNSAPLNSRILFTQENSDSSHLTGWLTAYEAIHTILSADLLTLSSGEVLEFNTDGNRGVVALPQAFLFSGVRSILFSLWRINSISTSQFMSKFYWELKFKRQMNVQALQEAKIASLKDTFVFEGKKISRAHPYFWATFQLVGNPKIRPPSPTKLPPWAVIVIVYVCVILVALYITRKTMPGRG